VGWRMSRADSKLKLQCDWNLKNFKAGLELFNRIAVVTETEKHHTDLHLESYNRVRMEIWTHTIDMSPTQGGVSENDFILAAKIDHINKRELVSQKSKFCA
ncbi:hypothetical protein CY35_02G025900, partial [Sphagnum magellanicum]